MASSSWLSTNNAYVVYWIEVVSSPPEIENNRTWVEVKVWAKRTNTGYTTSGTGSITLKVDGTYHNSSSKSISINSNSAVYHSWSGFIPHNGDGSKTLTCSAAININGILSSSEQSYSETLSSIARVSSFTLNKSICELGTPFSVSITKSDSSFTHSVSYCIGGSGGERRYLQPWNSTSASASYTPPVTDSVYAPNSTTAGVSIVVDTYKNGTYLGSTSKTLTISIPSNVVPSLTSLSATRVGTNPWNKYVQSKSQCKLTVNGASGVYGSTIVKYSIVGGGFSSTESSFTTGIISSSGTISFTATITDSRGRTATKSTNIAVEPYTNPTINSFTTDRCNSNGTPNDDGIYAKCVATFTVATVTNNNKSSYFRYRKVGVTAWSSTYDGTNVILPNIDNNSAYEIQFVASDYFTSSDKTNTIYTAFTTMDFKAGGKGVAIGKVSETDNLFDIAMPTKVRNTLEADVLKCGGNLVVSSGTNANGRYTRYYDGTQICSNSVSISATIDQKKGAMYSSMYGNNLGDFAKQFAGTAKDIHITGCITSGGNGWAFNSQLYNNTTTSAGAIFLFRPEPAASQTYIFTYHAVGRWK